MKDKAPYEILYEDSDILVVDKKRNVFTIRTQDKRTFAQNLYHYLKVYLNHKGENLFIVHRLDYETSGLLVFAKSLLVKQRLQSCFEQRNVLRLYEGVIPFGLPLGKDFTVKQYLSSGKGKIEVVNKEEGKEAMTYLRTQNDIQIGTALRIQIETGRRNQIRLALSFLGYPLLGDTRYQGKAAKRLYLNAYLLSFPDEAHLKQSTFFMPPLWIKGEHLDKPLCQNDSAVKTDEAGTINLLDGDDLDMDE